MRLRRGNPGDGFWGHFSDMCRWMAAAEYGGVLSRGMINGGSKWWNPVVEPMG